MWKITQNLEAFSDSERRSGEAAVALAFSDDSQSIVMSRDRLALIAAMAVKAALLSLSQRCKCDCSAHDRPISPGGTLT